MDNRETGTVKWFIDTSGNGIIDLDKGGTASVHYRSIAGIGYRTLREGQRVEFTLKQEHGELEAIDVIVLY